MVEHKYFVGDAVVTKRTGTPVGDALSIKYLLKDHLGSTIAVVNDQGVVVQQFIYDPWGKQYNVYSNANLMLAYSSDATTKGYTGHEMVNDFDVIHMGGRTYNPVIGRFMQADPHIQFAGDLQSYNRYSYVMNNPMKYTDPTGYFLSGLKKHWRTALSIGIAIWAPWGNSLLATIKTGVLSGYIATGSLRGALIGGQIAGMFHGVGTYFEGLKDSAGVLSTAAKAGKVLAHGLVGGISSVLNGGQFGNGFLSAGVTQALSFKIDEIGGRIGDVTSGSYFDAINRAKRIIAAALVGGTTSALTGGKFANGAITGAFSRGFNDEAHWKQKMEDAWDDLNVSEEEYGWLKPYTPSPIFENLMSNKAIQCQDACIQRHYGEYYNDAKIIRGGGPVGFIGKEFAEYTEEVASRHANRNLWGDSRTKNYNVGLRQLTTIKQFRFFMAVTAVTGAAATGFVAGANAYCSVTCWGSD